MNHKSALQNTEESSLRFENDSNSSELEKLKGELTEAQNQIGFLNSVIVEIQRKNEKLSAKVEVLLMGIPAQESDDYNL